MSSRSGKIIRFVVISFLVASSGVMAAHVARHSSKTVARSTSSIAIPSNFAAPKVQAVAAKLGFTPPSFETVASGDFNGDGITDFAGAGLSCSSGLGNAIAVFLGKGDGTFQAPTVVPAGQCVSSVTAVRLRGENAPVDLIVADLSKIQLLRGKGDGTFEAPQVVASFANYSLTGFAIADFNGDGKIDVAACLFGGLVPASPGLYDAIAVLLGNGDGTLQAPLLSQSPADNNYTIAVGDFNNDGKLDVLTRPGLGQHGLYLSLGNGDGTFLPAYLVWTEPISIFEPLLNGINSFAVGDFNDDGNLDVAMNIDGARVDVLLGTGTGVFASTGTIEIDQHQAGGNGLGQIAAAKLSPNGHVDLVVGTGYGATLVILRGNGDGTFQSPEIYPLPQSDDEGLIVGDLNNDGSLDIAIGTSGGFSANNYLTVLLNDGDGGFGPPPPLFAVKTTPGNEPATNAVGVTLSDLTNNGKLDLIVTTWNTPIEPAANGQMPPLPSINVQTTSVNTRGSIAVLAGNGDGTFQTEQQFYVDGRRPIAVEAADLDGDGKKDLVTVNAVDNNMSILPGNGDRTFQTSIAIDVGTNPTSLAVADFNGDNKPDIVLTNLVDNTVSVFINQSTSGNISFAPAVTYNVGTYPDVVIARDFNHDGKIDLAVLSAGYYFASDEDGKHTQLSILLGNGDGTFAPATTQLISSQDGGEAMVAADFGRGEIDLAIAHFGSNQILIYQGDGQGHFNPGAKYTVGDGPEGLVAIDFDGDGKIDIAASSLNEHNVALLHGNGDATFIPAIKPDATSSFGPATWHYPAYMAAADLNGDGKPELVTTHLFEAAAAVLRNTTPTPVQLVKVVSRKVHGSAGTFDVDLPLTGNPGIECRSGGVNGDYTLVFTFVNPLTSVEGASVTNGTGTVGSSAIGTDSHQYIVDLTGVTDAQTITVSLTNVQDASGNFSSAASVSMGFLLGDITASGNVSNTDVANIKAQVAAVIDSSNFRNDVNANGVISNTDVSTTKAQVGNTLP
jgi:hypothetical protein